MTHTPQISALTPETKRSLTTRSNTPGLIHLALYGGALALTTIAITLHLPLWPALLLPQGILLVFLFTLSHECTHQTPFRTPWINEALGHAIALLIALPFIWFRYFHLAHHKHTNDPKNDPELAGGGKSHTWSAWAIYLSGWKYWTGAARTLGTNAFGQITAPYLPKRRHGAMRAESRLLLLTYLIAATSLFFTPLLLWVWIAPVLIAQPILRAYLLAEHGLCPPVANMLENSRTTFTNRLIRALAWNMPYHAEHHAFPAVPFHKLPDLHRHLAPHLKSTSDGYAAFTVDFTRSLER
ncbi:MAG: fatty acid desaturase [Paracoccaceae bacterium]|jgi:fatty acid desaturase